MMKNDINDVCNGCIHLWRDLSDNAFCKNTDDKKGMTAIRYYSPHNDKMIQKPSWCKLLNTIFKPKPKKPHIDSALFIIFADYLGYESDLQTWAERKCENNKLEKYQERLLDLEAMHIYKLMKKDYDEKFIAERFKQLIDLVFSDYKSNTNTVLLSEIEAK